MTQGASLFKVVAVLLVAGWCSAVVVPVAADQTDGRLDTLFERLRAPATTDEAAQLEQRIWSIWIETEDPGIDRLMRRGIAAMASSQLDSALSHFDQMVDRAPEFAEAWNKRATVHYMMGNFPASVHDIQRTLALEPRHFGALSGLGLIYQDLDKREAALRSFEAALALNPHLGGTRQRIEELRTKLRGRGT